MIVGSVNKIAFIDLEASGLGPNSWPIEVGWCFSDGKPEALLISPADDWGDEAWDRQAEALHGIAQATLRKKGHEIAKVCDQLNRALIDVDVFSDAPDWDGFWLYRLFSRGRYKAGLSLERLWRIARQIFSRKGACGNRDGNAVCSPSAPRARRCSAHACYLYGGGGAVRFLVPIAA